MSRDRKGAVRLLLFLATAATALAHEGEPLEPHDLWSAWTLSDPGIVVPLLLSAILYWRGATDKHGIRRWERACFWSGWIALVIGLVSPIHPLGEALFSAHMAQHEILMVVAAPLLVLGRPLVPFLWGLPEGMRRDVGRWSKLSVVERPWRAMSRPAVAWVAHAVILWGWHAPALFQATLTSEFVHSLQHISFLGSALLFWWALIRGRDSRMGYGMATLYVFTTAIHTSILGALLTFSTILWYPAYVGRTAAWGLTPLEDQQLGGLIMWVPAGITFIVAGIYMVAQWLRESDRMASMRTAAAIALAAVLLSGATACSGRSKAVQAAAITGGTPAIGKQKIAYYGCGSCHTIKGIPGAAGLVGPPLTNVAMRVYLGGVLQNTPNNMPLWIMNPKQFDEKTAMPNLHVTQQDAIDITAYLYSLQ